ncbi:Protein of unknown function [Poseidonocella pacifica]|uniref:Molybdopterin-guanine dinucleotide biosynthesis protein A n=1 Tax=Poseidonocella pacifica TaxID=871651 RepID=A0A1I0WR97_9RHOB|nr:DUF3305 domain-containing protein [Poseidonocella pacifica]SFA91275.1 Protein of unknown function [Poseidonocella pacifica]
MTETVGIYQAMRLGVVVRRAPGVTRWAKWAWQAVAVLPGAASADWKVMREQDGVTEFHAATRDLELFRGDTEAYLENLRTGAPSVYIILRETGGPEPLEVLLVTASPYEAQDYTDSGEELVEKVPMPSALIAWVERFVAEHHTHEAFKKRRRDVKDISAQEDGIGDPRIAQSTDVYRSPSSLKQGRKERVN